MAFRGIGKSSEDIRTKEEEEEEEEEEWNLTHRWPVLLSIL